METRKRDLTRLFPESVTLPLALGDPTTLTLPVVNTEAVLQTVDFFNRGVLRGLDPQLVDRSPGCGEVDLGLWAQSIPGVVPEDMVRPEGSTVFHRTFPETFWDKAAAHYNRDKYTLQSMFEKAQCILLCEQDVHAFHVTTKDKQPTSCFVYESQTDTVLRSVFVEGLFLTDVMSGEMSKEKLLERVSHAIGQGLNIRQLQQRIIDYEGRH